MRGFLFSVAVATVIGLSGATRADGVGFTEGVPPWVGSTEVIPPFVISPSVPDQDDLIGFYEHFEQAIGFDCTVDIQYMGTPRLVLDREAKLLQLIVEPFSGGGGVEGCAAIGPNVFVTGVAGEFGPLEPGQWEYRGWSGSVNHFTVVPESSLISVGALAFGAMLRARAGRR
jgi:hypothetical protein